MRSMCAAHLPVTQGKQRHADQTVADWPVAGSIDFAAQVQNLSAPPVPPDSGRS